VFRCIEFEKVRAMFGEKRPTGSKDEIGNIRAHALVILETRPFFLPLLLRINRNGFLSAKHKPLINNQGFEKLKHLLVIFNNLVLTH